MWRITFIFMVTVLWCSNLFSQEQKVFQKGNVLLTGSVAPVGLLGVAYYGGVEYAVIDKIAVGGILGHYSYKELLYGGTFLEWEREVSYLQIIATASYHVQLDAVPNLDLHASGYFGYAVADVSGRFIKGAQGPEPIFKADALIDGIFIGGRYFLSENFALYGAIGVGLGNLLIGLTLKL